MTVMAELQTLMIQENLSLVYYDDPLIVSYLTGFESDPHERVLAVLLFQDACWMICPAMEFPAVSAIEECSHVLPYKDEESPWEILKAALTQTEKSITRVGINEDSLTVFRYKALQNVMPDAEFIDSTSLVQNMRVIKQAYEIKIMDEAGALADIALRVGMDALETGVSEEEVVAKIEYEMKKRGVAEMSFSTMVLFGDHAASPHGTPGKRDLKPGELVLFDLGVVHKGYTSDVTRTVAYGEVSEKAKEVYGIVLEAQEKAQAAVKAGMTTGELDAVARKVITDAGYGDYFTHRLGHGLGKSVHEFPDIAPNVDVTLKNGMCFSIEPGIYIEGEVGIRIEDCVYVTDNGAVPFTQTSKELTVLPIK